ncbi:hypothetical protein LJC60_08580 [Ruminococcaceae bacterium OttesenSCG-928-D13]|nr:hypothetical protein [Ruminococcaceae bacterium OttesenSCG-928-D13]
MALATRPTRLAHAMEQLGTNASVLARYSGADHSLISKWQRGSRPLSARSKQLAPVARALLELDSEDALAETLAPYQQQGESGEEAMRAYLTGTDLPALPPRVEAPKRRTSGEYTVQYRVYLGRRGLRRGLLAMVDYLMTLPPQREMTMLVQGRYDWVMRDTEFAMALADKLERAFERGLQLQVVNRVGYSIAEAPALSGAWMRAHLNGHVRSRYYDGEPPKDVRFAAVIHGYCSLCVRVDLDVEDGLYGSMHTDPQETRKTQALCQAYLDDSRPTTQYDFFSHPEGTGQGAKLWTSGPLPTWGKNDALPDGSFYALCRVPVFGVMTRAEFAQVAGAERPELPEYLFSAQGDFAPGPHRLILCREDVRDGLAKQRRQHEALSKLLHRRAFVTREQLTAQLRRILGAMDERDDFAVALVPRVAFESLQLGLVCWRNSASVGWLSSGAQSVFANDRPTSGAIYGYVGHVWDRLLAGWKRQDKVRRQLRKWLAGKELDKTVDDSAIVRGWSILPKE